MATPHPNQSKLDWLEEAHAFITENPDIPVENIGYGAISVNRYYVDKGEVEGVRAEYKRLGKALAKFGKVEKTFDDHTGSYPKAGLKVAVSDTLTYEWKVPRDCVCSKQKVVKEVTEWVCEPVLA